MQRHNRVLSDDEFLHLLKAHVDHGFALIKNDTSGFKSKDDYVDYLVELTRKGLEQRTEESAPMIETTPSFGGLIDLKIGWENDSPVSVEFNRQTNNYLAVTGKPGSKSLVKRSCQSANGASNWQILRCEIRKRSNKFAG